MIEPMPYDCCMWLIIMWSNMYSREASYNVIISEWLVDIATRISFDDFQDVVVPPCKIIKPIQGPALWGLDIYPASM